jgi:hypothetical protein
MKKKSKKKGKKKRKAKGWSSKDFVKEVWKVMKKQEEDSPEIKALHDKIENFLNQGGKR